MNISIPRSTHFMFIASVVLIVLSLAASVFSVTRVLSAPLTSVTVPNLVGFEGFLTDSNGNPLADGTYSIVFSVYSVDTGGTAIWYETQPSVQVTEGLYAVQLGSVTSLPANLFNGNRWIGVKVGANPEMSPRTKVSSVPFALNAENANKLGGAAGMIALFETSCPAGWTEVTSTRGRVVVGVPTGGTVGTTVGTSLANGGTRTITDVPAHTHGPGTLSTASARAHTHRLWQHGFDWLSLSGCDHAVHSTGVLQAQLRKRRDGCQAPSFTGNSPA